MIGTGHLDQHDAAIISSPSDNWKYIMGGPVLTGGIKAHAKRYL
jgi:hypothetical protein